MTPWTVATRLLCPWDSFSRQEYWSGLPCPTPGDLPNPGTEHRPLTLQADSSQSEPPGKPSGHTKKSNLASKIKVFEAYWLIGRIYEAPQDFSQKLIFSTVFHYIAFFSLMCKIARRKLFWIFFPHTSKYFAYFQLCSLLLFFLFICLF